MKNIYFPSLILRETTAIYPMQRLKDTAVAKSSLGEINMQLLALIDFFHGIISAISLGMEYYEDIFGLTVTGPYSTSSFLTAGIND